MTELKMIRLFIEAAKNIIPNLDDIALEYELRQINIDEQGPVCSDGQLIDMFQEATNHQLDVNELYGLIEKICMDYCMTVRSL